MRVISLNTWGGRAMHPLMHFLTRNASETGIFCLQEMHDTSQAYRESQHPDEYVRWDLLERTRKVLPDHEGYFAVWSDNPDRMSVATFVRRNLPVHFVGDVVIHTPEKPREYGSKVISPRKLQYVVLGNGSGRTLTVANYHGLWEGDGKDDTPERLEQSRSIAKFLDSVSGPFLLCGDFNIHPGTESYRILREKFDREMVRDGAFSTTRTPLYRHYEKPGWDPWADYVFARGVKVLAFTVMPDLASDHAALCADLDW
ncbi:MAG TPA: endonuclease/exonuclease/phosphatase family protein [Candidatus Paceibacterota bacterium]|nr:endonuclease/exonuclease/phosphatase family protein [Candidatus Paceibacterota bacterium]